MHDDHLGDSLDMAKRVAVGLLRHAGFQLAICPLPSLAPITESVYRRCLGLETQDRVCNPEQSFYAQRQGHVDALKAELSLWAGEKSGIVFLDPDKGVSERARRRDEEHYITIREVADLIAVVGRNVVAVYHHSRTADLWPNDLIKSFQPIAPAIGYDFGAALLCFISLNDEYLQRIRLLFESNLNPKRVGPPW